jgi:UDP-glucose 4-epimerase
VKTIAVTGAAGFIGSNLIDELMSRGYGVAAIDDLSMGSLANLEEHRQSPRFAFHQVDVRDLPALRGACRGADAIIHLAAFKIPRYGGALQTLQINAHGAEHALEVGREAGVRVLLASTSDVYGRNPKLPFAEDDDSVFGASTVPRWSYAVSKLFEEHLALAYREAYGSDVVLLRFFGSYGPRQHRSWWGGPQAVFIEAVMAGAEMEIHGDGSQTRSFTYVSDTVNGIARALESDQASGQVFNIGSTHEISILELARMIHELVGADGPPKLRIVPYEKIGKSKYEDVPRRIPNLEKARRLLGYEPQVSLRDGLVKTIEWTRRVSVAPARVGQSS